MIEPLRTEMTSRSFFLSSDSERIVTLSRDKLRQAGDDHGVPGSVNTTSSHTMSMKLCFILLGGIMIRSWAPTLHLIADVFFLRLAWQYYSLRRPRPSPVAQQNEHMDLGQGAEPPMERAGNSSGTCAGRYTEWI